MVNVTLSHNPFLITTEMSINSEPVHSDSELAERTSDRLQMWIEDLFDLLYRHLNEPSHIRLAFQGLETDYADVQIAAREAENLLGITVEISHIEVGSAAGRLDSLRELQAEALHGPLPLLRGDDFSHEFENSLDPAFDVNVIATMSSGKSTVINGMLGFDLLPAKNEACTATIARIRDRDDMTGFSGRRFHEDGSALDPFQEVSQQILEGWNSDEETFLIEIEGNIPSIKEQDHASLVLVDTPGPNNSRNEEHDKTTRKLITNKQMPVVLYVMNATQLSTNDDKSLLSTVRDAMGVGGKQAKDRFLFVVNKIDTFDPEKGTESVMSALENVKGYLAENKITDPRVFPVSAIVTKLARVKRRDPKSLTRKETGDLATLTDLFIEEKSMHMLEYMPVSPRIHRQITEKLSSTSDREELASIHSGLPILEAAIEEYLIKYAYPARVANALRVVRNFLDRATSESEVYTQIEEDEANLHEVEKCLAEVTIRMNDADRSNKFKEELRTNKFVMTQEVKDERRAIEKKFEGMKRIIGKILSGTDVNISDGERRIEDAKDEAKQSRQDIIVLLEDAHEVAHAQETERLKAAYQQYIVSLFGEGTEDISKRIPALQKLQSAALTLPNTSSLKSMGYYEKEVVVGTYTVSTSKWYNPFSWGRKETRDKIETQELIDLNKVWKDVEVKISEDFYSLIKASEIHMQQQAKAVCEGFISVMDERLDKEFKALIKDKTDALLTKESLAAKIAEAKKHLAWIEQYRQKLDSALSFTKVA